MITQNVWDFIQCDSDNVKRPHGIKEAAYDFKFISSDLLGFFFF